MYYGLRLFAELTANGSVWLPSTESSSGRFVEPATADPLCRRGIEASPACCAPSCGGCGGAGCEERPGGEAACCHHAISTSGRFCNAQDAPCSMDATFQRSPVAQHATMDAHGVVRVLLIARSIKEHMAVGEARVATACIPRTTTATRTATLIRLEAPSLTAKHHEQILLAGQTWSGSVDGAPSGHRHEVAVSGALDASGDQECFHFTLPPLSAALLTVPPR